MKKSTKGAVAASAAALLLLGGMGTQASWTDNETAAGTPISSGRLDLTDSTCGTAQWLLGQAAFDPLTKIIPGTLLTKTCTFTLNIEGAGITATLGVDAESWSVSNGLSDELDVEATFTEVGGGPTITTVTAADNGMEIEATLTVELPTGATDASQALTTSLNDLSIEATQS